MRKRIMIAIWAGSLVLALVAVAPAADVDLQLTGQPTAGLAGYTTFTLRASILTGSQITGVDASLISSGALNQVWPGGVKTAFMDSNTLFGATPVAQDSQFLYRTTDVSTEDVLYGEDATQLWGVFSFATPAGYFAARDIAQVVLPAGQMVSLNTSFSVDVRNKATVQLAATSGSVQVQAGSVTFASDLGAGFATSTANSGSKLNFASTQHLASVTLATGTTATVTPSATAGGKVLLTDGLSIANTPGTGGNPGTYFGSLDLANNDLAVSYTSATHAAVLAAVSDMVRAAAAVPTDGSSTTPTWTGKGVTSSSVQAHFADNGPQARALGVFDNNFNANGTPYFADGTLDGVSLGPDAATQANHVIVKYLYMGDLNGDGLVNGADYNVIDNAFVKKSQNVSFVVNWQTGDLNGDGLLNGTDYNFIDNAELKWVTSGWSTNGPPVPPPPSPGANVLPEAGAGAAPAVVPEPGTLGLLALGGLLLARRRR